MTTSLVAALTTTASCAPCELAQAQGVGQYAAPAPPQASPAPSDSSTPQPAVPWEGCIGVEGEVTGDGRMIEHNALRWEDLPLPMRYTPSDIGGHDGAVVVGRIATLERRPGGKLWATGDLDPNSAAGAEAIRHVDQHLTNGVSMDLDEVSFEVRVAEELMKAMDAMMDPDTEPAADEESLASDEPADRPPEQEKDADGRVTVAKIGADDEVQVTTDGRIRAATIVAIPAFSSAKINLAQATDTNAPATDAMAAAGAPAYPPRAWFANPGLAEPSGIVVTDDGRIYGHLAAWNTCHISHTHSGCVKPPRSRTGYAYFHLGLVRCADGTDLAVGHVTLDTTHADVHADRTAASNHYEHTGTVVADVRAGEDAHGIWLAGAVRPGLTDKQLRSLRSAPLSGDWRGQSLDLVAALCVNVAGFPVPRPKGLAASGDVVSLVAAGLVPPRRVIPPGDPDALSLDDLRYLKRLAARERARDAHPAGSGYTAAMMNDDEASALRRRVTATSLAMRVRHPALRR